MKTFVFCESFFEVASLFSGEDYRKFLTALIKYGLFDEEPDFSTMKKQSVFAAKASFTQIKQTIDASKRRYKAATENGKRGGRPKNSQKNQTQNQTNNQTYNQSHNQTRNQTQNLNKNKNVDDDKDLSSTFVDDAFLPSPARDVAAPRPAPSKTEDLAAETLRKLEAGAKAEEERIAKEQQTMRGESDRRRAEEAQLRRSQMDKILNMGGEVIAG